MKTLLKHIVVTILTLEAKMLIHRKKPIIIAVAGSVGKTSTKEAIYATLRKKVHARKSDKSYNSEFGVPLSVLGLRSGWNSPLRWLKNIVEGALVALHPGPYPEVLILEMGVDRPGDMERLTKWIHPEVVVLTRFPDVPVHVEFFESPEAIIEEKMKLVRALKEDGVLVYNQDDERLVAAAQKFSGQAIGYSRNSLSPFTGSADKIIYEHGKAAGFEFMLTHLEETALIRVNSSLGIQHVYNYTAALAVATLFDISVKEASEALREYTPPPGRMRLIDGIKDTLIIDDSYNSSPVATERSLHTLRELKGVGRRIAVLGDMLELGQYSVREHERIGEMAAAAADILITIGVRAKGTAIGALEHGMDKKNILEFDDSRKAGKELQEMLQAGDVVLVKGSQSIRAERVVEEIMAHPEDKEELLVRQGKIWKQI